MYPPQSPIITLVPGDDWSETVTITDDAQNAVDLTGWVITTFEVRWPKGVIALSADLTDAANGMVGFSAADSLTTDLPLGQISTLTLKMRSPTGIDETLYRAGVNGSPQPATNAAIASLPGIQGPRGQSFHVVDNHGALSDQFGQNSDMAIIGSNGAQYRKVDGVWEPTGFNFWGTLLDDAGAARDDAQSAAQSAAAHVATLVAAGADPALSVASRTYPGLTAVAAAIDASNGPWRERLGPHLSWWDEAGRATGPWLGEAVDEPTARAHPLGQTGAYYLSRADSRFYALDEGGGQTEVMRGTRKALPSVRLIVAETDRVIVFDGDDPTFPMWMVFAAGPDRALPFGATVSAIKTIHSTLAIGTGPNSGLIMVDLAADCIAGRRSDRTAYGITTVAGRNAQAADRSHYWSRGLVSSDVRDLALFVTRSAPCDPVTGIVRPAIALATAGDGTLIGNLIQPDDQVFDLGVADGHQGQSVELDDDGMRLARSDGTVFIWHEIDAINADTVAPDATYSPASTPALAGPASQIAGEFFASSDGLTCLKPNPAMPDRAMVAHIAADHATGWMTGETIFAGLADTDTTPLVDQTSIDRSPAQNHPQVTGTITRAPTVPGGTLVAYSGFSSTHRLQVPLPGVRLDDDHSLHLSLWALVSQNTSSIIAGLNTENVYLDGPQKFGVVIGWVPYRFAERGSNIGDDFEGTLALDGWHKVDAVSDRGRTSLFVDGKLIATGNFTHAIDSDPLLSIGGASNGSGALQGRLALVRLSKTAPTAAQVAHAYHTERPLIADGVPATLYGAVNAITDLTVDPVTRAAHLSTADGQSSFAQLVRTDQSDLATSAPLAAHDGVLITR